MRLDLVTVVVSEYDPAIEFFVDRLGFELVDDAPAVTNDGRSKRWGVVRPPRGETGVLLARADGGRQAAAMGRPAGGRGGVFLRGRRLHAAHRRAKARGLGILPPPRDG